MAHCERKRTLAHILLLAVVAAATVTGSRAWPIRITRNTNIADVQVNLKGSINALFLIIQSVDYPPAVSIASRLVSLSYELHRPLSLFYCVIGGECYIMPALEECDDCRSPPQTEQQ